MYGCANTTGKQTAKENLLLENKKYFNSERAAKILYEEAKNYFKYGSFIHKRPNSKLEYFVVLGDEPPYRMRKITKKEANKIASKKNKSFVQIYVTKDNRIEALIGTNAVSHYFDASTKKTLLKKVNGLYTIDAFFQEYGTFCDSKDGKNECYIREDGEDRVGYGQMYPLEYAKKAFKNYAQYYNGKTLIYNAKSQPIKKINYRDKQVTYFFYEDQKKHKILCDYKNEQCKISRL